LQSNEGQKSTINLKEAVTKAGKWLRQFIIMLVAVYIVFIVIVNLPQMNQVSGVLLVSLGLFGIIMGSLIYVARLVKKTERKFKFDE